MAIFGFKNKEKKEKATAKKAVSSSTAIVEAGMPNHLDNNVIIRPRITEKSGLQSQNGVYTFEVAPNANKQQIAKNIFSLYKIKPVKIAMINLPDKQVIRRGRKGVVRGLKKAVVTVKKGDKIDFV